MLALLVACAGDPPVARAVTDGGTWEVHLADTTTPMGRATVTLAVTVTADAPVDALRVTVVAGMPGMHHDEDPLSVDAHGNGTYGLTGWWSMRGRWVLDGALADTDRDEAFTLELDVE
jgi:hypothetical protein